MSAYVTWLAVGGLLAGIVDWLSCDRRPWHLTFNLLEAAAAALLGGVVASFITGDSVLVPQVEPANLIMAALGAVLALTWQETTVRRQRPIR